MKSIEIKAIKKNQVKLKIAFNCFIYVEGKITWKFPT